MDRKTKKPRTNKTGNVQFDDLPRGMRGCQYELRGPDGEIIREGELGASRPADRALTFVCRKGSTICSITQNLGAKKRKGKDLIVGFPNGQELTVKNAYQGQ